jgi:hypothetical protein
MTRHHVLTGKTAREMSLFLSHNKFSKDDDERVTAGLSCVRSVSRQVCLARQVGPARLSKTACTKLHALRFKNKFEKDEIFPRDRQSKSTMAWPQ